MISKRTKAALAPNVVAQGDRGVVPSKKARAMGVEITSICAKTIGEYNM